MNPAAGVFVLALFVFFLFLILIARHPGEAPNPVCPYTAAGRENAYRVCGPWCHLYLPDRPPHCPFLRWVESLQERSAADARSRPDLDCPA